MKAIVYSTHYFEKEALAKANQKKHDITLLSNSLNSETAKFAEGKDAVIVFTNDDVSGAVIEKLKEFGVRYISTRSLETTHIDRVAASNAGIKIANIPSYSTEITEESLMNISTQIIKHLDNWQANKCMGKSCACAKSCHKKHQEDLPNHNDI